MRIFFFLLLHTYTQSVLYILLYWLINCLTVVRPTFSVLAHKHVKTWNDLRCIILLFLSLSPIRSLHSACVRMRACMCVIYFFCDSTIKGANHVFKVVMRRYLVTVRLHSLFYNFNIQFFIFFSFHIVFPARLFCFFFLLLALVAMFVRTRTCAFV